MVMGWLILPLVDASEYEGVLEDALDKLEASIRNKHVVVGGVGFEVYGGVWVARSDVLEDRRVTIVGDIHGDHYSFDRILSRYEDSFMVFLGDYVDRGPPEGQVHVLYNVLRLFVEGAGVVPLRGNHEPPEGLIPYPHDYPQALSMLYGSRAGRLHDLSRWVFEHLPYALLIEKRVLLVHGGPPISTLDAARDPVEYLGGDKFPPPISLLEEVLWSDPLPEEAGMETIRNHVRGAGYLWGYRDTLRVLGKLGVKMIIRGHEWTPNGYKHDHGGRVLTLFSRLGHPYPNRAAAVFSCDKFTGGLLDEIARSISDKCIHLLNRV